MPYTAPFPYTPTPYEPQPAGPGPGYCAAPQASFYDQQRIFQSVAAEINQPVLELQTQQSSLNSEVTQLNTIATALQNLGTAAAALQDTSGVLGTTITSSNPTEVTGLAGTGATSGTHSVNVTQLATAQQNESSSFASDTSSPLANGSTSGSLAIQVGSGSATTFSIDSSTTLDSLASSINAANIAVTAQVVPVVSGSGGSQTTSYALEVTGTNTGASNAISFTETNLSLNMAQDQLQAAGDAQGTIDGTSFDSPTNVVNDAVPGVTLNLMATTPSPVTLSVSYAPSALSNDISSFVNAYNSVVSSVGSSGNSSVLLQALLGQMAGDIGQISPTAQGQVQSLIDIGISTIPGGQLSLDTGILAQAIAADPHAVATVFSNGPWGATKGIADELVALSSDWSDPVVGTLSQMAAQASQNANNLNNEIAGEQYAAGTQWGTVHQELTDLNVAQSELHAQNLEVQALLPPANSNTAAGQGGYDFGSSNTYGAAPYGQPPGPMPYEPWNNNGMAPPYGSPSSPSSTPGVPPSPAFGSVP